jgi:hypothetical protein
MATKTSRYHTATSAGDLARRTTLGVLVAVVALLVGRGLLTLLDPPLGVTGPESPFALTPLISSAIAAGVGAALVYALLVRFTDQPEQAFVTVSGAVFVLMLLPVVLFAPNLGVSTVGQVVLAVFHVLVAAPLVAFITGAVRL